MIKLSDYVARFVAERGVRHVFFVPGGAAMHLNDSFGNTPGITLIGNLHEQASAIAAENYAKVTRNLGVAMVTAGPGGTNAVTGVAGAWLDSTPMLVVSGQVKRADLTGTQGVRQTGVQEVDICSVVRPITKYAVTVVDPATIRFHLEKAAHLAMTGRPGPVWIDLPLDVQAATIDPAAQEGYRPPPEEGASPELSGWVARTLELLDKAERPILLVGNGIRLAHGEAELLEVAEQLQIPVMTTWLALDLVPDSHPRFVGRPGAVAPRGANFSIQNSDLLIAVGARLDLVLTGFSHQSFARGARKVMVDIDPAELAKMKTPIDVPALSDARAFLREMLRQLEGRPRVTRPAWLRRCLDWKARYPVVTPEHRALEKGVSSYVLSEVLGQEVGAGGQIVSGSSGAGIEIFLLALAIQPGMRVLHTTALGAMGYGPPAAIGACLASGGARTVVVDGDGGLQLNVQELATIASLQLPIKLFILNNEGYSSIRVAQNKYFGRLVGADQTSGLKLPPLRGLAAAYGLPYACIEQQRDLRGQLREVLDAPGPTLCEVMVPRDEIRAPSLGTTQGPNGSMVSRPLEDLWPFLERDEFRANMIIPPLEE